VRGSALSDRRCCAGESAHDIQHHSGGHSRGAAGAGAQAAVRDARAGAGAHRATAPVPQLPARLPRPAAAHGRP
jgi:hypothetical protein